MLDKTKPEIIKSVSVPERRTITEGKDEVIKIVHNLCRSEKRIKSKMPYTENIDIRKPIKGKIPSHSCFFRNINSHKYKISELIGITRLRISPIAKWFKFLLPIQNKLLKTWYDSASELTTGIIAIKNNDTKSINKKDSPITSKYLSDITA